MLKTISAALLAVSVFAAPAFAGARQDAQSSGIGHVNSRVFNAYGWMGRDHHEHYRHHHRHDQHFRHHHHHYQH